MHKPYAQQAQAPYTCSECEEFFVVDGWIEAEIFYPKQEECKACRAPIDIDVIAGDVTPIR